MHIEFHPGQMTLNEARGVVALLVSLHGPEVVPSTLSVSCGAISISGAAEPVNALLTQGAREPVPFDVVQDAMGGNDDEVTHGNPAEAFGAPQAPAPSAAAPDISQAMIPTTQLATTATPAVDSAGLPWDERIHSSGRTLVKDGTWRRKGGISDDAYNAVLAELKGQPASPPAPVPAVPVAPQPPSSTAPAAPTPPPAPPVSPPAAPTTGLPPFPAFMTRMAPLAQAGKTSLTRIAEIAQTLGVTTLPDLAKSPDLIPTLEAMVMAEVGA